MRMMTKLAYCMLLTAAILLLAAIHVSNDSSYPVDLGRFLGFFSALNALLGSIVGFKAIRKN